MSACRNVVVAGVRCAGRGRKTAGRHGFFAHSYADDLQIYDHSSQTTCLNLVPRMSACIEKISTWMASNRLKLNPSKTEVIWLGSSRRLKHCPMDALNIAGVSIKPSSYVRDLGVYVDGDLLLEASHLSTLPARAFTTFVSYVSCAGVSPRTQLTRLIRALVHSRVDYCNGVLADLPQTQINRLQSILRAAARLVLQLPGWASVSNLMHVQLHWLSISQRIQFKLCSGGVQVSSQHGADILTRSLRAYLVF